MEILNSQNDTLVGDSGFLAGRQRQVFDLLSLFQTSQLIGFIGENGSGKTTLIKNGLFPELKRFFGYCREKMEDGYDSSGHYSFRKPFSRCSKVGINEWEAKIGGGGFSYRIHALV